MVSRLVSVISAMARTARALLSRLACALPEPLFP
nr:MAG: hypothetical protein [Molluscum contagiosum virus]